MGHQTARQPRRRPASCWPPRVASRPRGIHATTPRPLRPAAGTEVRVAGAEDRQLASLQVQVVDFGQGQKPIVGRAGHIGAPGSGPGRRTGCRRPGPPGHGRPGARSSGRRPPRHMALGGLLAKELFRTKTVVAECLGHPADFGLRERQRRRSGARTLASRRAGLSSARASPCRCLGGSP